MYFGLQTAKNTTFVFTHFHESFLLLLCHIIVIIASQIMYYSGADIEHSTCNLVLSEL